MDAKALSATIRKAVRAATKTTGDPLHGLTVSVRTGTASLMQSVDVRVTAGITEADVRTPDPDAPAWDTSRKAWTDRARAISDRLHELAAPAIEWADGRHSFCDVTLLGYSAPSPRDAAPAEEVPAVEEPATDAEDAARFLTAMSEAQRVGALPRARTAAQLAALLTAAHGPGTTGPATTPAPPGRPALRLLQGGRAADVDAAVGQLRAGEVPDLVPAAERVVGPNRALPRSQRFTVDADQVFVLAAVRGEFGRVATVAARVVLSAALTEDYLADHRRVAQMLRDVIAEYEAGEETSGAATVAP